MWPTHRKYHQVRKEVKDPEVVFPIGSTLYFRSRPSAEMTPKTVSGVVVRVIVVGESLTEQEVNKYYCQFKGDKFFKSACLPNRVLKYILEDSTGYKIVPWPFILTTESCLNNLGN